MSQPPLSLSPQKRFKYFSEMKLNLNGCRTWGGHAFSDKFVTCHSSEWRSRRRGQFKFLCSIQPSVLARLKAICQSLTLFGRKVQSPYILLFSIYLIWIKLSSLYFKTKRMFLPALSFVLLLSPVSHPRSLSLKLSQYLSVVSLSLFSSPKFGVGIFF